MLRYATFGLTLAAVATSSPVWADDDENLSPVPLGAEPPTFTLPRLTEGEVAWSELRGMPTVVVTGTTEEAAPACRTWMVSLVQGLKGDAHVYQIAVLDNPWYLPHFLVKGRLKDFVPAWGYDLVLLDWGKDFRLRWGFPRDDDPRVYVFDRRGHLQHQFTGPHSAAALEQVLTTASSL